MKLRTLIIAPIAVIACGVAIAYVVRNPERSDMDAAARRGVAGKFVTLGDGVTHYDVAGPDTGQRVLLAHGFSVPSYIWDSTVTALSGAGFRVARYDYFGRGYSDRPDVAYNPDLYDRQMTQLLDSLGWKEPVDIVGLSMGGPVTAEFVARHPDRVRSLTLVDPAAGPATQLPALFKVPMLGSVLWQTIAVPGMADGQFSDFVDPKKWPDWADRYRVQMQYRGFGRSLRSTLSQRVEASLDSVYARAGRTGKPVLLIWGKEDSTVAIRYSDGVRKAIPQAQYHPIDRAAHLPHMERTDVVNPLLIEFLRGVGARE
jgi:pimeloyl-ACP methyl ester carboxylesterase